MRRRETISSVTVVLRQGRGRPPWQENLQQQNQQQQQQRQVLGNDLTLGCTTMARRRSSWWSLLRTLTRCVTTSSWSTPPATFLQIVVVIVCAINDKRQGRGWNEQFHGVPGDHKDKPTLLPQRFLHSCSQVRSPPLTVNSLPGAWEADFESYHEFFVWETGFELNHHFMFRYSDFLGLHEKLVARYQGRGRIIPPAPEKSLLGTTRVKI